MDYAPYDLLRLEGQDGEWEGSRGNGIPRIMDQMREGREIILMEQDGKKEGGGGDVIKLALYGL